MRQPVVVHNKHIRPGMSRKDSRNSESGIAGLFRDRDSTVEAANRPYRGQKAEDERESRGPSSQISPSSKSELRSVELRSTSDRQTDYGDQGESDVENHTGSLQSCESSCEICAIDTAEYENATVQSELRVDCDSEVDVL